MRRSLLILGATALTALVAGTGAANAQRFGGGGFHMRGGSMHTHVPTNFHGPGSGGGGIHHDGLPPRPNPSPHPPGPGPDPRPGPGPGPHPGPGPGPHPDPGPGPHPPGPPPGPGPRPLPPPPPLPPPGWGWGWGWDDDPFWDFAAGAAIAGTTAAVVASASQPDVVVVEAPTTIGSVAYALPPNCTKVVRAGNTYYSCNNVWYRPQYLSSGVSYLVVPQP